MDDNSGEERPERVKYCDVEDLQQHRAGSQDTKQIETKSCTTHTF